MIECEGTPGGATIDFETMSPVWLLFARGFDRHHRSPCDDRTTQFQDLNGCRPIPLRWKETYIQQGFTRCFRRTSPCEKQPYSCLSSDSFVNTTWYAMPPRVRITTSFTMKLRGTSGALGAPELTWGPELGENRPPPVRYVKKNVAVSTYYCTGVRSIFLFPRYARYSYQILRSLAPLPYGLCADGTVPLSTAVTAGAGAFQHEPTRRRPTFRSSGGWVKLGAGSSFPTKILQREYLRLSFLPVHDFTQLAILHFKKKTTTCIPRYAMLVQYREGTKNTSQLYVDGVDRTRQQQCWRNASYSPPASSFSDGKYPRFRLHAV